MEDRCATGTRLQPQQLVPFQAIVIGPCASRPRNVVPSRNGMVYHGTPSLSPAERSGTIWGWVSRAAGEGALKRGAEIGRRDQPGRRRRNLAGLRAVVLQPQEEA
jgi:hypothetical protein